MILNSLSFFVFFAFVFIIYWNIPKKFQWILLLLAGYCFYGSYKLAYLVLIILTSVVNYYSALNIYSHSRYKKTFLPAVLLFNLGTLFLFKYFNFFSLTMKGIWGINMPQFKFLLPLGISFYTMQTTGYLLDVYKGKIRPERHFGFFSLFVTFFPLLSAGPIERYHTLMPQLKNKHEFDYHQVTDGVKLFTLGVFKKAVIADNLGIVVDRVFSSLPEYKGVSLIAAVIFFSWQIFMDFSGYTDMARGVAKMIGINLVENFNLPYFADSIQDFWRRWHISLSSWLRDYIYIPLGGSRKGALRAVLNILIVFGISGLWHGASWNFILWGLLFGVLLSMERICKKFIQIPVLIPAILKVVYTYCLVSILWIFFRSATINDALYILRNAMIGVKNVTSLNYLWASLNQLFVFNTAEMIITFFLLLTAVLLETVQRKVSFITIVGKQPVFLRYAVYIFMILMIVQLRNAQIKEFIYVRF